MYKYTNIYIYIYIYYVYYIYLHMNIIYNSADTVILSCHFNVF